MPRPIFLSGKVLMDDGSPIPPNVTIQRVCSGVAHAVAYADSKGHFSFQWGQTSGMFMDASESSSGMRGAGSNSGFGGAQSSGGSNPLGADPFGNQMMNCELQASMAGYRSDTVNLFNRNSLDNPNVGNIVLHRLAGVEGASISATSFLAPKDAKKAYDHGLQSLLKNKYDEAGKDFEKAVAAYPKYADAWVNLGKVRLQQKSVEPAREAMLKAVEADPKLVLPYVELGLLSAGQQNWEETSKYMDRATRLDPIDYPNAWYVSAVAYYNLKNFDAAEKSARAALKLDPKHRNPRADYVLGLVLVEKRDYSGAEAQLKSYLSLAPNAPDVDVVKDQLGKLQKYIQSNEAAK